MGKMIIFEMINKSQYSLLSLSTEDTFLMSKVSGFCLKCKTYGPIKDGKMIVMSNGRTRCAGFCSQEGCTGKISKIVS